MARVMNPALEAPLAPSTGVLAAPGTVRLRRMVDAHHAFVWRALRRVGLADAHAEDLAQEVFVVAAARLSDIDPERERSFLLSVAVRLAANARRRHGHRREVLSDAPPEQADPRPLADDALDARRMRATLDVVLDALPMDLRVVLVLTELEEMSAPEIAAALDLPVGTVASRLRRAREEFQAAARRVRLAAAGPRTERSQP